MPHEEVLRNEDRAKRGLATPHYDYPKCPCPTCKEDFWVAHTDRATFGDLIVRCPHCEAVVPTSIIDYRWPLGLEHDLFLEEEDTALSPEGLADDRALLLLTSILEELRLIRIQIEPLRKE